MINKKNNYELTIDEKEIILIELTNRKIKLYREFELEKDNLTKSCIVNELTKLDGLIKKVAHMMTY